MTVLYWAAAAAALVSAGQAGWELVRDRSGVLAAWVLSMTALAASLALAAGDPAVLHWAGGHGTHDAGRAGLAAIGAQLTLVIYYAPGLARIAFVAQQRARLAAAFWARTAMRALAASAGAELALTMGRSAVVAVGVAGMRVGEPAITAIAVLQGMAVICGIGGVAAGPAAVAVSSEYGSWLAYWRLLPLWAVVRE